MSKKTLIAMSAPVSIQAAEGDEAKGPKTFSSTFYTGGALSINGYDLPVVVDLAGLQNGKVLVANLDHDSSKRVGNFDVVNDGKQLVANGKATAATAARDEVVNSAADGYQWQASLEVMPHKIEQVAKGKSVNVNGQTFTGPLYVTRSGTLKGFAFVSHGADDNTTATIAASAARNKEKVMKPEVKAWAQDVLLLDVDTLSDEQKAALEANFGGKNGKKPGKIEATTPFEARKIEAKRREDIRSIADKMMDRRNSDHDEITAIEAMVEHAIEAGMSATDFRSEMYESFIPQAETVRAPNRGQRAGLNNRVLEAAICQTGRLDGHEKHFSDQELQCAHDHFRNGIGLKQLILLCAEANGYKQSYSGDINETVLRAAFGKDRPIHAQGFSTLSISDILSNNANKFLMDGWNAVDMTPMQIASIRPVRDFKQITTVNLTGDLQFEKVGASGEIKHGTLGDESYTNQADTYAKMLAITRKDIINDDLGALTAVPRRLGRGAALKLNDIFWTEFLDNSTFFTAGRNNVNTAIADMTIPGLDATETIFMNQTDPDGKPLGIMPAILLVPTALKNKALALMDPQGKVTSGASAGLIDSNVFAGRFRVYSSPYMSNSSYTGYSAAAWYMLADPRELPVIEIVALNGRVEPVIETADADFNTLGIQMRGYSDVGVALQEYRAGVYADGGAS